MLENINWGNFYINNTSKRAAPTTNIKYCIALGATSIDKIGEVWLSYEIGGF